MEIARRSRGTTRIANALLRRICDFAQIKGDGRIYKKIADFSLESLNVDTDGLDKMDNKILSIIINKFRGRINTVEVFGHLGHEMPKGPQSSLFD